MKRTFIILGTVFVVAGNATAQESITPKTINASGGSGQAGTTYYDWSIGEMIAVSTYYNMGKNIIVTQGLLQNEISTPVGTKDTRLAQNLQVFPNPASTMVNVQLTSLLQGTLSYKLMDMAGRVIINQSTLVKQSVTTEQLNIAELAAATYMLEVSFTENGAAKQTTSYKIDKLK